MPHSWLTPRRLMLASIAVALLTITLKTWAWWVTDSVGLLSDALEGGVNLAGATFGLWMVTVAAMPPDHDHHFGHDKAEYFSSGFEGILIIAAACAIVWAALPRFWHPRPLDQVGLGVTLSLISAALNGGLAWVMLSAARRHRSMALEGDARHLITDVWTSAGVVAGVALVAATGLHWIDPLVAILVALNIMREGALLVWRSSQGLMDAALNPKDQERIHAVLQQFSEREGGPEVLSFNHVLTRKAGQRRFVNLHMHVPARWTVRHATRLRTEIEHALLDTVPGLLVSIQMLPLGVEPPSVEIMNNPAAATPARNPAQTTDKGGAP